MPGHLNDLSGPMRVVAAVQGGGVGVTLSAFTVIGDDRQLLFGCLLFGGVGVVLVAALVQSVWLRRADRAFRRDLEAGAAELASGAVVGERAVGRVVRRRISRRSPSWSTAGPEPEPAPSVVLVVTALTEAGARRVGVLVPARLGLTQRQAPVVVQVHPSRRESALLDVGVGPEELEAVRTDPRWRTLPLPTDSAVAGGYTRLLAVAATAAVVVFWLTVVLIALLG